MYGYGADNDGREVAIVAFVAHDRQVRFTLPMPEKDSLEFLRTETGRVRQKGSEAHLKAYEQAVKQRWRALVLTVKALLEAIETGILTFDEAFLARIMLPNGTNVGDAVMPRIAEAYETGEVTSLLPALDRTATKEIR